MICAVWRVDRVWFARLWVRRSKRSSVVPRDRSCERVACAPRRSGLFVTKGRSSAVSRRPSGPDEERDGLLATDRWGDDVEAVGILCPRRACSAGERSCRPRTRLELSVPVQAPRGGEVALWVDRRVDRCQERDSERAADLVGAPPRGQQVRRDGPSRRSRTGSGRGAWRAAPGCWRRSRPRSARLRRPAVRSCFASCLVARLLGLRGLGDERAALARPAGPRQHVGALGQQGAQPGVPRSRRASVARRSAGSRARAARTGPRGPGSAAGGPGLIGPSRATPG